MNTDETPTTAPEAETKTPEITADTSVHGSQYATWVPAAAHTAAVDDTEVRRQALVFINRAHRQFYTLLAITGVLLFILYIGMLVFPSSYGGVRGQCTSSGFLDVAFWLNPIAYLMVIITGSFSIALRRAKFITLGILMIIAAPIGWFITGAAIVGPMFCGI